MELTYKGILHSNLNGRLIAENLNMENRDFLWTLRFDSQIGANRLIVVKVNRVIHSS